MLPAAARANRWVFYNRDGSPRSFAEIRERFAARIGGSGRSPMPASRRASEALARTVQLAALETGFMPGVGKAPARAPPRTPSYARLAYLMLAGIGRRVNERARS